MRIDDFEFEEEKTFSTLSELLRKIAQEIEEGEELELPMPSRREGVIKLSLGEPIETGIEVNLRKQFVHVKISLAWVAPETVED